MDSSKIGPPPKDSAFSKAGNFVGDVWQKWFGNMRDGFDYNPPFPGAGTRPIWSKLQDVISVPDFRAPGDSVDDWAAATQRAVDYMRVRSESFSGAVAAQIGLTLHFPPGFYRIKTSIDMQSFLYGSWGISGPGAVIIGADKGYPVFDCLGSTGAYFDRLTFIGDDTNIPWSAITHGRITNDQAPAGDHVFNQIRGDGYWGFRNEPGGGYTDNEDEDDGAFLVNSASEGNLYIMPVASNRYPNTRKCLIVDGYHHITPPTRYTPSAWAPDTPDSCIQHRFVNINFNSLPGSPGPAILLYGPINQLKMDGYATSDDLCAIEIVEQASGNMGAIEIDVHVELAPDYNVLWKTPDSLGSCTLSNCSIKDPSGSTATVALIGTPNSMTAPQLDNCELRNGTDRYPATTPNLVGGPIVLGPHTTANGHGRIQGEPSASLVSAANMTLGNGNGAVVSANNQINLLDSTNWEQNSEVDFIFTGTPTIKHMFGNSGSFYSFFLKARADVVIVANDTMTFRLAGTTWYQTGGRV